MRWDMNPRPIELPPVLHDPKFRFIKLGNKEQKLKAPIETGWNIFDLEELKAHIQRKAEQWDAEEANGKHSKLKDEDKYVPRRPEFRGKLNNYAFDDPEFQKWLKQGKNYGVTGAGNLVKLESDDIDRWKTLGILDLLPETFTVQSSTTNRQHFYFLCPEISDCPLFDPESGEDIGHIRGTGNDRGKGGMVVGPGSLHPSGVRYTIVKDVPIAPLQRDVLEKIKLTLSKPVNHNWYRRKDKTVRRKTLKNMNVRSSRALNIINSIIKIEDIAMPESPIRDDGTEIQGSHPIHGSETGKNFSINPDKNTWHCFRCDSGGGPLEWLAVAAGLISCSDAGPRCLRRKLFKQVLDLARKRGYKIPEFKRSNDQLQIIENRIILEELPDEPPNDEVVVIRGPPRIGKTHKSIKYLIKSGNGNYVTHRHSIVEHAIEAFRKEGGQNAVWLEGKHRPGMCREDYTDCSDCEFCPHDRHSYMDLKDKAASLLIKCKILTKREIPSDLCPYYSLKLAEESASYCFTVVYFINDIKQRNLTVLDEDPTLAHFYPASVELLRIKSANNEYKSDNTLGKDWVAIQEIKNSISSKSRSSKVDKFLLYAISELEEIKALIDDTSNGKLDIEQCRLCVAERQTQRNKIDATTANKALEKLDETYRIDGTSNNDIRDYFTSLFFPYKKRPAHMLSSGASGYHSLFQIGDATAPVVNMSWSATTANKIPRKILIIGNTLAELFAKSLGNAVVIEILKFKYARNFVVIPVDSGNEGTYRGTEKNQQLKVRKLIKTVAGGVDSRIRHPILALVGSKERQDWLIRSLGGIVHAAQEEGEIGHQWNHRGGYVNIFYQNSTMSRGLDVDQYNVICVHDADFAQPFLSAAKEAGDENAEATFDSIIMDETTNSALRISPIMGRGEFHPKIVVIRRNDLWKVKYLDEQVLGGSQGGRTPDINHIAKVITENNLTGTAKLVDGCITFDDTITKPGWGDAVKEGKLLEFFKLEMDRIRAKGDFTEEEVVEAMDKILKVLRKMGNRKWLSVSGMRDNGLKCKNMMINPALSRLYYEGKIEKLVVGRKNKWSVK
jgi:hypothetical protein